MLSNSLTQPDYTIQNLDTKQVISLDGQMSIKWEGETVILTGDNIFKILKEKTEPFSIAASLQQRL